MSRRPFRVGRARTGLGLFATKPIRKNARIVEYKGPLLTGKAAQKAENGGNRYLYEINKRWTIDGAGRDNVARYGNHSCNPNADSYNVKKRVFIRAIKNIGKITKAMKMVAASKMRNAQVAVENSRGIVAPFVGIKLIDLIVSTLGLA